MNCLEAQKQIRAFLGQTLQGRDLEAFAAHVEQCSDCREELELYYAIEQALGKDIDGFSWNAESGRDAVEGLLRGASRKIAVRRIIRRTRIVLRIAAGLLAALLLLAAAGVWPWPFLGGKGPSIYRFLERNTVSEERIISTERTTETSTKTSTEIAAERSDKEKQRGTGHE